MDGTSIVAILIVILFFASYPRNPLSFPTSPTSKPQPTRVVQTNNTQETSTPYFPQTSTTYEKPAYIDNSPAPYRSISSERMDAVIRKYNKGISVQDAERIKAAVDKYCREKNIDPRLVLALMARESGFKPNAVSPSGAIGLGQILPINYEQLNITDPYDIEQNTRGTVYYLRKKLDEWEGSADQVGLALASYLKGTGEIRRAGGTYSGHTETYVNDILRIRSTI